MLALHKSVGDHSSLCNLRVLCDSVVGLFPGKTHHRDTEHTEVAQRNRSIRRTLIAGVIILSRSAVVPAWARSPSMPNATSRRWVVCGRSPNSPSIYSATVLPARKWRKPSRSTWLSDPRPWIKRLTWWANQYALTTAEHSCDTSGHQRCKRSS